MTFSVGQRLRQARLEQGLDPDAVAARTKISLKYLKAIEADDRSCFPGGFFYKSFVDQYARALSVDTQEIDAEINQMLSAEAPLPLPGRHDEVLKYVPPVASLPRVERARMYTSLSVFVLALVGCSGFYVWWHKIQIAGHAPFQVAAGANAAVRENGQPSQAPAARPGAPAVPVSLATSQPPTAAPGDATQTAAGYKILLDLMAREETWLAVSSDGRMIFRGTLAPNETKTIEGREFAKLRVRNAAALEVKLNGKLLGPLGEPGQFLVVVFTPDKFHIIETEKESD